MLGGVVSGFVVAGWLVMSGILVLGAEVASSKTPVPFPFTERTDRHMTLKHDKM